MRVRVVKPIDPFGYHMVGCKVGANAIRLHDEVVFTLANLFRSIGTDPVVEPVRLSDVGTASRNILFSSARVSKTLKVDRVRPPSDDFQDGAQFDDL